MAPAMDRRMNPVQQLTLQAPNRIMYTLAAG